MPSMRAVTPAVATVLLVAVVVVVSASITVVAVDSGTQLSDPTPTVAFDSEVDENVVLTHTSGQTLDSERIEIHGGEPKQLPSEIQAGDTVEVEPSGNDSEIRLVWTEEQSSAPLASVDLVDAYRDVYEDASQSETESEPPSLNNCQPHVEFEQTVDANGGCVAVVFPFVSHVENASDVILLNGVEVETVTDTTNVELRSDADITDTVDVDDAIFVEDESEQPSGDIESGTVVEK